MKDTKLEFKIREPGTAQADWPKYRIDTADGTTVAEVFGDSNTELGRTMAAAPELLEALKDARAFMGRGYMGDIPDLYRRIDAAIAKAEGSKE